MKQLIVWVLCGVLTLGHCAPLQAGGLCRVQVVRAGDHRGAQAVQQQKTVVQTKFVTPYAVALGVPVANYSGVTYSYNAAAQAHAPSSSQLKQAVMEALQEILQSPDGAASELATGSSETPSLVQQNCAACHSGAVAKGGFRVDVPLDDAARLNASRQVLLGTMPQGKQLNEQARGNLLGELVGVQPED